MVCVQRLNVSDFSAAVLEELGQPLAIRTLRLPEPGVGQVLVRVHYSGICGKQLAEISGKSGPDKFLPHCLGHEGGGIVAATGDGVTKVMHGDSVVLHWRPSGKGIESGFPRYFCDDRDAIHPLRNAYRRVDDGRDASVIGWVGGGRVTTFQEYSIVSENRLTKIPQDTDLRLAALLGCAVTTGLGVVINEMRVKPGQSVIVLGCGGVGLNVVQGCRLVHASPIIGMDLDPPKIEHARQFGLSDGLANRGMDPSDMRDSLKSMVGGQADFVVDTTGHPHILDLAFSVCKTGGTVCMIGQAAQGHRLSVATAPMHSGKKLTFSSGGATDPDDDIPRYLRLHKAGLLDILGLVTRTGHLDEVNTIIQEIREGKAGRTLLDMRELL